MSKDRIYRKKKGSKIRGGSAYVKLLRTIGNKKVEIIGCDREGQLLSMASGGRVRLDKVVFEENYELVK